MRLKISLRCFLVVLVLCSLAFGIASRKASQKRKAKASLAESGFLMAYDLNSIDRGYQHRGFGGGPLEVEHLGSAYVDYPQNENWLTSFGLLELANPVVYVDGRRRSVDDKQVSAKTDRDIQPLSYLDGLVELKLKRESISDSGLQAISGLSRLRILNLAQCNVTDQGLRNLGSLKSLEHLDLRATHLSDEGLRKLEGLANLKYLNLSKTKVSGAGLKYLSKNLNLETLYLNSSNLDQENIKHISNFTKLENLYLEHTEVYNLNDLLDALPNLKELSVSYTRIDDKLIKSLQARAMRGLYIDGTQVSDDSYALLIKMEIHDFSARGTQISDEKLEEIESALRIW